MLYRAHHFVLAFLLAIVLVLGGSHVSLTPLLGISDVSAQSAKPKRRSLFSIIFGKRDAKKKKVKRKAATPRRKKTRKRNRKKAASARKRKNRLRRRAIIAPPQPKAVEKLENAKTILVIGDFFAAGLADGLEVALAEQPAVTVVDRSKASSGFVRSDIINWPTKTKELITELKPTYIIAMLGSNDRQLMIDQGKKLKKRTPEWDAAYKKRIQALADTLRQSKVPFTWMGLPPVRFSTMNNDFLIFNQWYRTAALGAGGKYTDVWDGFSSSDGQYSRSGPDIRGQIVLLRGKDGINLTKAGRRRLAFYVEGDVSRSVGGQFLFSSMEDLSGITIEKPGQTYDPAKTGRTVVIRLDDPESDGATTLAGETLDLKRKLGGGREVPVGSATKLPGSNHAGRVDNFSWPPTTDTNQQSGPIVQSN